jgi:tol-pal system protein YbgF
MTVGLMAAGLGIAVAGEAAAQAARPAPAFDAPIATAPPSATESAIARLNDRIADLERSLVETTQRNETLEFTLKTSESRIAALEAAVKALTERTAGPDANAGAVAPAEASEASPPMEPAARSTEPPAAPAPAATAAPVSLPGTSAAAFQMAQGYLVQADYPRAAETFGGLLTRWPEAPEAITARYWLGETHFVQKDWANAAGEFLTIVRTAPDSAVAPDAYVRLASSLRQLGQPAQACKVLGEFRTRFARPDAATLSRANTERMASACGR